MALTKLNTSLIALKTRRVKPKRWRLSLILLLQVLETTHCCWSCKECAENQYLLDEYHCQTCPRGFSPNLQHTGRLLLSSITQRGSKV